MSISISPENMLHVVLTIATIIFYSIATAILIDFKRSFNVFEPICLIPFTLGTLFLIGNLNLWFKWIIIGTG